MRPKSRLGLPTALLLIATAVWCVVLPPVWALNLGERVGLSYVESLAFYVPELIVGAIVVASLSLLVSRPRMAVVGFVFAAVAVPAFKFSIGSPTYGAWYLSLALLCMSAWRLHVLFKSKA